jgi:aspartyl-tRNA synthetase
VVRAVPGPKCGSRAICDRVNSWAQGEGAPGMGYIILDDGGGRGPIASRISDEALETLKQRTGMDDGDAIFFSAGKAGEAARLAGQARLKLGVDLNICEKDVYRFCWVVDFPMYERDETTGKIEFSHNPFSMPQGGLDALETMDPLDILAYQYDIVCNGTELSSGAIRNHLPDVMLKAFEIAGYSAEEVEARFGGMLNAFRYGAPPHGGFAPGIDRIVMLIADEPNIREVILFPMNQRAEDLMMGAPSDVQPDQLRELSIRAATPLKPAD